MEPLPAGSGSSTTGLESCQAVEATSSMLDFGIPLIRVSDTMAHEHAQAFPPSPAGDTLTLDALRIIIVRSV
jgi:hypothetical protein